MTISSSVPMTDPAGLGGIDQGRPRAVFFGTPGFADVVLRRLLLPGSPVDVVAVVTQPDRPVGRSQTLTPPPVKVTADHYGIPVRQPVSLRRPAVLDALRGYGATIGVVVAYGRLLPAELLAIFPRGCVNVHASLLPRWRGAWPVGAAIRAGDLETGVSIMVLDVGMDTGPVIATATTAIGGLDTTDDLEERLAVLGADLLVRAISPYLSGDATPVEQDHERATYCRPVTKLDGLIDWSDSAESIERHVRAMHSWPGAWTRWSRRRLVIRRAHVIQGHVDDANGAPGQVIGDGRQMYVVTGSGVLALDEVQLEGRGLTPIRAFAHGYPGFAGSVLSSG